jgi:hypothetical protein
MAAIATILAACSLTRVSDADTAQIPGGPPEVVPGNPEPIGPISEVGRGRTLGFGWRYLVYETAEGLCTQLETATGSGSACGSSPPTLADEFGGVSIGESTGGPVTVDGMAGAGVAEVWVRLAGGERIPATLMPLALADLPGQAFIAFAPQGASVDSVVGLDADGKEIASMEFR